MIGIIQKWLLFYALLDFTVQIVYQMPMLVPEDINALDTLGVDTSTSDFDKPGLH